LCDFLDVLPILSSKMSTKITYYFCIFITSSPKVTKNSHEIDYDVIDFEIQ
jgi:hypothetical protein